MVQLGLPVRVEVLRDPPALRPGEVQGHPPGDAQGLLAQPGVPGRVGRRQQRLDGVHVAVHPAVGIRSVKPPVPGVDEQPRRGIEELLLPQSEGLLEEIVGAGQLRHPGRRRGQHDERVGVAGLLIRRPPGRIEAGEPAAGLGIPQPPDQTAQTLGRQFTVAGPSEPVAQAIDVGHPGGDPGEDRLGEVRLAERIQPGRATLRMGKCAAEIEQPVGLRRQHVVRDRGLDIHHGAPTLSRTQRTRAARLSGCWPGAGPRWCWCREAPTDRSGSAARSCARPAASACWAWPTSS